MNFFDLLLDQKYKELSKMNINFISMCNKKQTKPKRINLNWFYYNIFWFGFQNVVIELIGLFPLSYKINQPEPHLDL